MKGRLIWIAAWVVMLFLMGMGARHADSLFMERMERGAPAPSKIFQLIPKDVDVLAYDRNFTLHWKKLRASRFFSTFSGLTSVNDRVTSLKLNDAELGRFEKWVTDFWGPSVVFACSPGGENYYLLSPVGNYRESVEWLQHMSSESQGGIHGWEQRFSKNQWLFEMKDSGGKSGLKVEFGVVDGVGVLAVGRKPHPMKAIVETSRNPEKGLKGNPDFGVFLEKSAPIPDRISGFVRSLGDGKGNLGLVWHVDLQKDSRLTMDLRVPVNGIQVTAREHASLDTLNMLRRSDDEVTAVFSMEDLNVFWEEFSRRMPTSWTETFKSINSKKVFGTFKQVWDPVMMQVGKEIFVGMGEAIPISDRFQVPVPILTLAVPYNDPKAFIKALEATVYRANTEADTNIMIRKTVRSYGEYYELRMGPSTWRRGHGLKQLPIFSFTKGLLILSTNTEQMEKVLQAVSSETPLSNQEVRGIDIKMDLQKAPEKLRILLGAVGLFSPQDDNVFLSPSVLHFINEMSAISSNFGDSHLVFTYEPGFVLVNGNVKYLGD